MTDFVKRVTHRERDDWVIRSLLDQDFYKFTMGYFIQTFYPDVEVEFSFINRHPNIPVDIINKDELLHQLWHLERLNFSRTDLSYLRGMDVYGANMFSEDHLLSLRDYRVPSFHMGVSEAPVRPAISMAGSWKDVTYWETLMLPILNELFYRTIMEDMPAVELDIMYARAKDKLYRKLIEIKQRPHIRIADFGLRRRHSHLWQKYAIEMAQEVLGEQFTGTSNTWMAWNRDLVPIGTNAHELPMVLTALADTKEEKIDAQYEVLRKWETLFPMGGLRIVLPDTYGTGQFLRNMPKDLAERVAHEWRGFRLDSGNPMDEARRIIIWYQRMGVDPWRSEKVVIPSDGLDVESILAIDDVLNEIIHHPYGWGTMFTNDFRGCHPRADEHAVVGGKRLNLTWDELFSGHSFVCKVTRARKSRSDEWRGAVKLSNNPRKATGTQQDIAEYLKTFGDGGREDSAVFV